ncbi:MAG: BLUF domain-containing protein [Granulosicoccus sp.]
MNSHDAKIQVRETKFERNMVVIVPMTTSSNATLKDEVPAEEEVFQLLYISAASKDFSEEELSELLTKARESNENLNVSGMLLFHEGSFIQALEGDEQAVKSLYEKISKDTRHTESRVLFRGYQKERHFAGWSMGFYRSRQSVRENVEGFHHFLATGLLKHGDDDGSATRKALLAFREGKWRAAVET